MRPCFVPLAVFIACNILITAQSPQVGIGTASDPDGSAKLSEKIDSDQKTYGTLCASNGSDVDQLIFRNFMLEAYTPLRRPVHIPKHVQPMGSFGLWQKLLTVDPFREVLRQISSALRKKFGRHSTVWGMKAAVPPLASEDQTAHEPQTEWEFYWVLDGDAPGMVMPSDVASQIAPWLNISSSGCDLDLLDTMGQKGSLTMFSIDIDAQALRTGVINAVSVYLEDPVPLASARGSAHTRSRVFSCSESGFTFKNAYVAYEIEHEAAIAQRVTSSPHFPHSAKESYVTCALYRTELMNPVTHRPFFIHLASKSKPQRDGIYYSGASIGQLIAFLEAGPHGRCNPADLGDCTGKEAGSIDSSAILRDKYRQQTWGWPRGVLKILDAYKQHLYFLKFDVGFDFVVEESSGRQRVRFLKTAFYGTL